MLVAESLASGCIQEGFKCNVSCEGFSPQRDRNMLLFGLLRMQVCRSYTGPAESMDLRRRPGGWLEHVESLGCYKAGARGEPWLCCEEPCFRF